jgi:hypothetical protein
MTQEKKRVLRGLMWQNFVHLKIEENHDIFLDEFRFFRVKDNSDVTNELGLDKDHASA